MSEQPDYGTDLAFYFENTIDLDHHSSDLALISGVELLTQAIRNRLSTPLSALISVNYGSRLGELVGFSDNEITTQLIKMVVQETLQAEPRVAAISKCDVSFERTLGTITINLSVIGIYSDEVNVEVNVS